MNDVEKSLRQSYNADKMSSLKKAKIDTFRGLLEIAKTNLSVAKNYFICDGCGKEYPIEDSIDVNTPNLSGVVICRDCIEDRDLRLNELARNLIASQKPLDQEFQKIVNEHFWEMIGLDKEDFNNDKKQ